MTQEDINEHKMFLGELLLHVEKYQSENIRLVLNQQVDGKWQIQVVTIVPSQLEGQTAFRRRLDFADDSLIEGLKKVVAYLEPKLPEIREEIARVKKTQASPIIIARGAICGLVAALLVGCAKPKASELVQDLSVNCKADITIPDEVPENREKVTVDVRLYGCVSD